MARLFLKSVRGVSRGLAADPPPSGSQFFPWRTASQRHTGSQPPATRAKERAGLRAQITDSHPPPALNVIFGAHILLAKYPIPQIRADIIPKRYKKGIITHILARISFLATGFELNGSRSILPGYLQRQGTGAGGRASQILPLVNHDTGSYCQITGSGLGYFIFIQTAK